MGTKDKRKIKIPSLLEAIKGSGGVISRIAETLQVDWHTAKKRIEENEQAKSAFEAESETLLDMAESVLVVNIAMARKQQTKGYFADTSDAKWVLSKKGKKRGYGDNIDVTSGGDKITEIGIKHIDYRTGITKTEE